MHSAPIQPAKKAQKTGPSKWTPGDKLWDSAIFHKKTTTLANYPSKTTVTEEGNDAVYNGLKNPENFFSVEAFCDMNTGTTTEVYNGKRLYLNYFR